MSSIVELFFSYAHEDEALRKELEKHLSVLRRSGLIKEWHDRRIDPGAEWRNQIDAHVRSAKIILLLISPDFLASDYCYDVEMKLALDRHERGEAIVIPVILRPVEWADARFAKLQALPRDGKAVTTWPDRDQAFAEVAREIAEVVKDLSAAPAEPRDHASTITSSSPASRFLDAAIPSHILKDQTTELQVLVRLPDSAGLKGILQEDEEAEARPEDVDSKPFKVGFPRGLDGRPGPVRAKVQLTSPDFEPRAQVKQFFIPPDSDSEVVAFFLTALRVGRLKVLVELQWEDTLRGTCRLLTECVAEAAQVPANVAVHVARLPIGINEDTNERPAAAAASPPMPRTETQTYVKRQEEVYERAVPPKARVETFPDGEPFDDVVTASPRHTAQSAPRRPPSRKGTLLATAAVILLIAVSGTYTLKQMGSPPQRGPDPPKPSSQKVYSGRVLNAATMESVPDARVTLELGNGARPLEGFTDRNGIFKFTLSDRMQGLSGKIMVHADRFGVLETSVTLADSTTPDQFQLVPQ